MDTEKVKAQAAELAVELDDIAEGLFTTNALRGRQLKKCVGKVNGIVAALASEAPPAHVKSLFDAANTAALNLPTSMNLSTHPDSCTCYGCGLRKAVTAFALKEAWENTREIREREAEAERPSSELMNMRLDAAKAPPANQVDYANRLIEDFLINELCGCAKGLYPHPCARCVITFEEAKKYIATADPEWFAETERAELSLDAAEAAAKQFIGGPAPADDVATANMQSIAMPEVVRCPVCKMPLSRPLCEESHLPDCWFRGDLAAALEAKGREVREQIKSAQYALEHDRTKVAECVTRIKKELGSYQWLIESRGCYEWDDDRWMEEFRTARKAIREALEPMIKIAADWSNCPKTKVEVQEARALGEAKPTCPTCGSTHPDYLGANCLRKGTTDPWHSEAGKEK